MECFRKNSFPEVLHRASYSSRNLHCTLLKAGYQNPQNKVAAVFGDTVVESTQRQFFSYSYAEYNDRENTLNKDRQLMLCSTWRGHKLYVQDPRNGNQLIVGGLRSCCCENATLTGNFSHATANKGNIPLRKFEESKL